MSARVIPLSRTGEEVPDDEALVAACARGEAAALGALFERHSPSVWRYLRRFLGHATDVDDLVQGTFIEAWRSAPRFRGGSSVRVWLLGIAHNLARRHARSRGRRRALLDVLSLWPVAPARPIDELTDGRLQAARVVALLAELSTDHRAALVWVDLEGVSTVDTARALGVRPGTLRRRLFEARRELRDRLAEEAP